MNDEKSVLLVGIQYAGMDSSYTCTLLDELESLVKNIGFSTKVKRIVPVHDVHPRFLMGRGNAETIARCAQEEDVGLIVFDGELTPAQARNWAELSGVPVFDREEVILAIFASRAQTRAAKLQVELARLQYILPRLKGSRLHLDRQRGGAYAARSGGETKLETDRRLVLDRIAQVKRELKKVVREREITKKLRVENGIPRGAIVGYTNAGKSSLLNALTGSGALVEDKLFATLDPQTKRLFLPGGRRILLSDTVGFLRRLPHGLIEAFKSTLEETAEADYLIHVIDASHPEMEQLITATHEVLREIGVNHKPVIEVFNKIDQLSQEEIDALKRAYPDGVFISVKNGIGIDRLIGRMREEAERGLEPLLLELPLNRYDLVSLIKREGKLLSEEFTDNAIVVSAEVPERIRQTLLDTAILVGSVKGSEDIPLVSYTKE
ncbi:MAG TPA: GTPase HflX [Spirochaetia bacterium]|nr:GTPase HflX [Spirochaetia bacterium]